MPSNCMITITRQRARDAYKPPSIIICSEGPQGGKNHYSSLSIEEAERLLVNLRSALKEITGA